MMFTKDCTGPNSAQELVTDSLILNGARRARAWLGDFGIPAFLLLCVLPHRLPPVGEPLDMGSALFLCALPLFFIALSFRLWSNSYVKTPSFNGDGPYRFLRNPREFGALLAYAAAGLALAVELWALFGLLVLAFVHLSFTSLVKEREYFAVAGGGYLRYQSRVPRWLPRFTPGSNRERLDQSWLHAFIEEKWSFLWFLAFCVLFGLRRHGL